jgi:hypothetical protein
MIDGSLRVAAPGLRRGCAEELAEELAEGLAEELAEESAAQEESAAEQRRRAPRSRLVSKRSGLPSSST